jgi:hypothetical protein
MFSVAGASLILPLLGFDFLPMLPIQILLNNLLYDLSQSTITADNVDLEYVEKPKRWDIGFIKNFMISLGPVSSIFDFLTFFIMLFVFLPMVSPFAPIDQKEHLFQTAWFIESLVTQTIVIFAIRTRHSPFWKSKPGKLLTISSISIVAFALILPYTFLGDKYFSFVQPPIGFFAVLAGLVAVYLLLAEVVKNWFYARHAYRLEQVLIPKRRAALYLSRTTRLVQDLVAVMCLRVEDEISIDSLLDDLARSVDYPFTSEEVVQRLHHLRRAGLISVDWRKRLIKREKPMKEYVTTRVITNEMWPIIMEDWLRASRAIKSEYGDTNPEYQELLFQKQK